MDLQLVREIAAQRGLDAAALDLCGIVRAIQGAEGNEQCFATGESRECEQSGCLWRDCCY